MDISSSNRCQHAKIVVQTINFVIQTFFSSRLALDISQLQMKQKALNIDLKGNKGTLKSDQNFIKRWTN